MSNDKEDVPRIPYKNGPTQNLGANKEIQKLEDMFNMRRAKKSFEEIGSKLMEKNTYFGKSKVPSIYENDVKVDLETTMKNINSGQSLKINTNYCQKCPVFKNTCKHMKEREQLKDKYSYPITTYSALGWLEPLEGKFQPKYTLNSETKSFYDTSHLSINNR